MNILISLDQLGNSILGGDPDETISSRLGRLKKSHDGKIPKKGWLWLAHWLDEGLDAVDKNHSMDAIEEDEEHKEEIIKW